MLGKRFHFLVAVEFLRPDRYRCICDCGNEVVAYTGNLNKGRNKSCGCWKKMTSKAIHTTHGMSYSDEYKIWQGIRTRCKNPNATSFPRYGGSGITICERWDNSFDAFHEDMGPRPSKKHSVDRINNDGNYEPSNCRWATPSEQRSNTTTNVFVEYQGRRMTTAQFAELTGFTKLTVYRWVTRDKLSMEQIEERLVARQKSRLNPRSRRATRNA